ncbi:MAG: hypothetical protein N3D12_03300 [Candidatus Methanomethyliaceae archaeon]|nr:hypothetical protein [Candidatus Methanomethyliaceae archaeon]
MKRLTELVQVGFEPKIVFICPLCSKEVEVIYERGRGGWTSEHANCLNFTVLRTLPINQPATYGPLVFIALESDFSVMEAVEKLREILNEEVDTFKRQKLEAGIKRLESRRGFAEKNLQRILEAIRSGAFGLKILSGKDTWAGVWRAGEKFFGIALSGNRILKREEAILATSSQEELQRFVEYWLHYWEGGRAVSE